MQTLRGLKHKKGVIHTHAHMCVWVCTHITSLKKGFPVKGLISQSIFFCKKKGVTKQSHKLAT